MAFASENALNSPLEEMEPYKREFQYQGSKLWSLLNSRGVQTINIYFYIYSGCVGNLTHCNDLSTATGNDVNLRLTTFTIRLATIIKT